MMLRTLDAVQKTLASAVSDNDQHSYIGLDRMTVLVLLDVVETALADMEADCDGTR